MFTIGHANMVTLVESGTCRGGCGGGVGGAIALPILISGDQVPARIRATQSGQWRASSGGDHGVSTHGRPRSRSGCHRWSGEGVGVTGYPALLSGAQHLRSPDFPTKNPPMLQLGTPIQHLDLHHVGRFHQDPTAAVRVGAARSLGSSRGGKIARGHNGANITPQPSPLHR
jgi:hypothetical protein